MPAYAQINNFMRFVRAANPTFERVLTSSLRPLITVLNNAAGTPLQVCQAIAALPAPKVNRYLDALYYLLATYPGLPATAGSNLNLGALGKTNAVFYTRTAVPVNFNPVGPQKDRVFVAPPSAFTGLTVEQYILANSATTGVLLIHLSGHQPPMNLIFNGRSTLAQMNSVLRVARLRGCPLCVLTMDANADVCSDMWAEFRQVPVRRRVYEPNHHMGSVQAPFRAFATSRANLVVMGFDASVCVFANVFGANETMPDGSYRPPLISMANIVMSRATLVTQGTIATVSSATMGRTEFGPLFDT